MDFLIVGAGAVGGVVGAQLHEHGHSVTLVARGRHLEALRSGGLTVETPDGTKRLDIPVVEDVTRVAVTGETTVLLTVKSQDSTAALTALASVMPSEMAVVCLQNGVANEQMALRWFSHVYGVVVNCPATFLEPGVVRLHSPPPLGRLDIGRYLGGIDETCGQIADTFSGVGFISDARADIMRWKYRKLLIILGNAVEAISGRPASKGKVTEMAVAEGERVFAAAGIDVASVEEERVRQHAGAGAVPGAATGRDGSSPWKSLALGGSTWQSLARDAGTAEADYLNGEIVLLGRLHGVPTPVNWLLQTLVRRMAIEHSPPGSLPESELLAMLPGRPA